MMSALPPKADMGSAPAHVCFVPIADMRELICTTERPPRNLISYFYQAAGAAAAFFRFLRQPSRPNAPRPVAKSGSAAGSGVASGLPTL